MRLSRKAWTAQGNSGNVNDEIHVAITMTNGKVIKGRCLEREYADACYDFRRHNPRPDSLIYLLTVIAHPTDIKSIERIV